MTLIQEENLSKDHEQIIEAITKKTMSLVNQNKMAVDYLNDIEGQLEAWQAEQQDQNGSFNVLDNVEEED